MLIETSFEDSEAAILVNFVVHVVHVVHDVHVEMLCKSTLKSYSLYSLTINNLVFLSLFCNVYFFQCINFLLIAQIK